MRRAFEYPRAAKCLKEHFGKSIADLGLEDERLCVCAAGALLAYLTETQKNALTHILELRPYERSQLHGAGPRRPAEPGTDADGARTRQARARF